MRLHPDVSDKRKEINCSMADIHTEFMYIHIQLQYIYTQVMSTIMRNYCYLQMYVDQLTVNVHTVYVHVAECNVQY